MTEKKNFWQEVKVKLTVAAIVGAATLLWTLFTAGWRSIIKFFAEERSLPTWAFFLIGFILLSLFCLGLFYRTELRWERMADVPTDLLSQIQKSGRLGDLLTGKIRVRQGQVYYADFLRRNVLVEDFKASKLSGIQK